MNFKPNKAVWTSIGVGVVIAAGAVANTVTIPNTFTAHTPALAAQVNANFLAVKTSIDDNANRIAALESPTCPTGFTRASKWCYENSTRAAQNWHGAAATCRTASMSLCPLHLFMGGLIPLGGSTGDGEWTADLTSNGAPLRAVYANALTFGVPDALNGGIMSDDTFTEKFRCCK